MSVDIDALLLAANRIRTVCDAHLRKRTEWREAKSYNHVLALKFIQANPGCAQSDVAQHLGLRGGVTWYLVEALIRAGLVKSEDRDVGRKRTRLTALGTKVFFRRTSDALAKRLAPLEGNVDEEAFLALSRELTAIQRALPLPNPRDKP